VKVVPKSRRMLGVDLFLEEGGSPAELAKDLEALCVDSPLKLKLLGNRGQVVWPEAGGRTDCIDMWQCRFLARRAESRVDPQAIADLLAKVMARHEVVQFTRLQEFDQKRAYTLLQGEE
jgi:isocitrate dehydrogenase